MNTPTIEYKLVNKQLPVFATNISQHKEILKLAAEGVYEEYQKNSHSMVSNVNAKYVSNYLSHLQNQKFLPLTELVCLFCEEISKTYFKHVCKYRVYNCWGMIYDKDDHATKHFHFPSVFASVVYIDISTESAPIVFEDELKVVPSSGSLLVFPGLLYHEVPKSKGKRIAVAMNIETDI